MIKPIQQLAEKLFCVPANEPAITVFSRKAAQHIYIDNRYDCDRGITVLTTYPFLRHFFKEDRICTDDLHRVSGYNMLDYSPSLEHIPWGKRAIISRYIIDAIMAHPLLVKSDGSKPRGREIYIETYFTKDDRFNWAKERDRHRLAEFLPEEIILPMSFVHDIFINMVKAEFTTKIENLD